MRSRFECVNIQLNDNTNFCKFCFSESSITQSSTDINKK